MSDHLQHLIGSTHHSSESWAGTDANVVHVHHNLYGGDDFTGAESSKLAHSISNVHGGHNLLDSAGSKVASSTPHHDGQDIRDADHALFHVKSNIFGGVDLHDASGHKIAHSHQTAAGTKVHDQHQQLLAESTAGHETWHHYSDWLSQFDSGHDPLSGLGGVKFPLIFG
jgi:hypothetical protein